MYARKAKQIAQWKQVFSSQMQAIREGLLWILPCLMVSQLILFIASIGEFSHGGRTPWLDFLFELYYYLNNLFPILLTAALSFILAMQWRLPRPPIALISIVYLGLFHKLFQGSDSRLVLELVISVATPLYSVPMIAAIYKRRWLRLVSNEQLSRIVRESLNLILPAIFVGVVVICINSSVMVFAEKYNVISLTNMDYEASPLTFGAVFAAVNSVLWFMGIHGYYALLPWIEVLEQGITATQDAVSIGQVTNEFVNYSFMGVFVFTGGSGATLGLVVILILFAKSKAHRLIAIASLPLSLFNINEVLLFGLPIIFNPRLFLPFLLAPFANLITAYIAISQGWVAPPTSAMPFSSPIFINGWLATDGDFSAVFLQLFNVALSALIYFPAVMALNSTLRDRDIGFRSLDTTYSRRYEEAQTLSSDYLMREKAQNQRRDRIERELKQYSQKEFCLEYQPQVCSKSGRVVGCEALIRAKDDSGKVEYPGAFLPWFEKEE